MKKTRPRARPVPLAIAAFVVVVGAVVLWAVLRQRAPDAAPQQASAVAEIAPAARRQGQAAARVGGQVITTADIERQAVAEAVITAGDRLAPGDEAYQRILNELIDQKLLAQEAAARGLDDTPEARRRLDTARERILGNVLVETVVSEAVTDEAIQRMYEEQVRLVEMGDEVRARHILVDTRQEAEAVKAELEAGADFAELAFTRSTDEATRLEGGDLGYFTADSMAGPLATAAYATPVGEVSDPVETEFGWHVVRVEDRRAAQQPSYESLRPRIVRFMTFDTIQSLLSGLRESTEVQVLEPDYPPPDAGDDAPPNPLEAFVDSMPADAEEAAAEAAEAAEDLAGEQ